MIYALLPLTLSVVFFHRRGHVSVYGARRILGPPRARPQQLYVPVGQCHHPEGNESLLTDARTLAHGHTLRAWQFTLVHLATMETSSTKGIQRPSSHPLGQGHCVPLVFFVAAEKNIVNSCPLTIDPVESSCLKTLSSLLH